MTGPPRCPFGHDGVHTLETIVSNRLISAYRARFGVNVAQAFGGIDALMFCHCNVCDLGFFTPPTPGGPEFYAELSRIPWYYAAEKEEYKRAAHHIGPNRTVLEVGCGKGAFVRHLIEPRYLGLEFNQEGVSAARRAGLDVRDEDVITFAASNQNQFDAVCAFQVLEHVPDPASFITACALCARPGGLVIFGVPNASAFVGAQPDNLLNMPPHHLTWWTERVFGHIAPRFGFEVVALEEEGLATYHREDYLRTVALRAILRKLRFRKRFVFEGPFYRLANVASIAIKQLLIAGFDVEGLMPVGHTLLVVLRKTPHHEPATLAQD